MALVALGPNPPLPVRRVGAVKGYSSSCAVPGSAPSATSLIVREAGVVVAAGVRRARAGK
jgi:hypothetical protein